MNLPETEDGETRLLIDVTREESVPEQYGEARSVIENWMVRQVEGLPERIDPDNAGQYIASLQRTGNIHEDVHLATRFLMGIVAKRIRENTEHGNVIQTLERLVKEFKLGNTNTLRRCINAAETFHCNPVLFGRWLSTGEKKRWYHMIEASRADVDPMSMGIETFQMYIEGELKNIERTAERVSQVASEIDEDDEETLREAEGVVTMLGNEADALRRKSRKKLEEAKEEIKEEGETVEGTFYADKKQMEIAKLETEALKEFVSMIHEMPCMACGDPPESNPNGFTHAHHVAPSVTAKKVSDWFRVPLCNKHHTLLHKEGHAAFKRETGFDIRELVARMLHIYITGEDARFPSGLD